MGFLSKLFSPEKNKDGLSETAAFWKDRALLLETEIKDVREKFEKEIKEERNRNRKREDLLQDRILISKGHYPISKKIEEDLGFNIPKPALTLDQKKSQLTPEQKEELQYFIKDSVQHGRTADEAEQFWFEKYYKK